MRFVRSPLDCAAFAGAAAALLLLDPASARAACNPATCDAVFACGSKECIGVTCETFFEDAGVPCRPAAGVCDVAESCTGDALACPTDAKKSAAVVCRPSAGACDGEERCTGTSASCPPDAGIAPTVSRVTLLGSDELAGGVPDPLFLFSIEVTGANLCTATMTTPGLSQPAVLEPDDGPPSSRLSVTFDLVSPTGRATLFPNGTYDFDINSGAITGGLDYATGAPDGFLDITSPTPGEVVSGAPTFALTNHCTNCSIARTALQQGSRLVGESVTLPPPVDTPILLDVEEVTQTSPPLPDGDYGIFADAIDGQLVVDQSFAGDPSGLHFEYLFGKSDRRAIGFSVPEPDAAASALAAAAALALCARARRRRAVFAALAAALVLLRPFAADAACSPATCDAQFDCGSKECVGSSCVSLFDDAGTPCRPAAGVCDVAESCTGHSLACPSDQKKGGVCRAAANACDAAESCDGSSDDCPADAPLAPSIARVSILDRVYVSNNGTPSETRELALEMTGANLCETKIGIPGHGTVTMGDATSPDTRIGASLFYGAPGSAFGDATYSFDVNGGAVVGTLDFFVGAQTGYIDIVSPSGGAIVGSHPSFSIANACLSCNFMRLQIESRALPGIVAETGDDFAGPPLDGSAVITLDSFGGSFPDGLPEGGYGFAAEGVDGEVIPLATFDNDPSGMQFAYRYGSSVFNDVDFEVPEPSAGAAGLAVFAALASCTAARGERRRRLSNPPLAHRCAQGLRFPPPSQRVMESAAGRRASMRYPRLFRLAASVVTPAALLLLDPFAAEAACNPATCDAVFACGSKQCIGVTCETFFEDAGVPCRSLGGDCDLAESCSGASLSCPSDKKKSAATTCRAPADACDAAEHCDGVSNDCPADTGRPAEIESVSILASTHRSGGIDLGHDATVVVTGTNLCSVRFATPVVEESGGLSPEGPLPARRMSLVRSFATPEALAAEFPAGTYSFDVNQGAHAGTIEFAPGAPNGSLDILAPPTDAVVGESPSFELQNHCTNCVLMRTSIENDVDGIFVGDGLFDQFPTDDSVTLSLAQVLGGSGLDALLLPGHYEFHAESIDGLWDPNGVLAGDPNAHLFEYLSGTSLRDEIEFSVPEAPAWPAALAAVMALAGCARPRGPRFASRSRGRKRAGRFRSLSRWSGSIASAVLFLACPGASHAACSPATCDAVFACGFKECVGVTCESFFEDAGVPCRAAAGVCDVAESCTGASLSCPSDKKKSAATLCRGADGPCDAAEHCTGTTAACPADVGITPTIDSLTLLERNFSFASGSSRGLTAILEGENLCTTTFESQNAITVPVQLGNETPRSIISVNLLLNTLSLTSEPYTFSVNRGAISGTVPFEHGTPNGGLNIQSPADGAIVGAHPTAELFNGCSNCALVRAAVATNDLSQPIGEAFLDPTFPAQIIKLPLDEVAGAQDGLADGEYQLLAEAIDGTRVDAQTFAGDPSGESFTYLSGTSNLRVLEFSVPEPTPGSAAFAAVAALAWLVPVARRRRRQRSGLLCAAVGLLLWGPPAAHAACNPATCDAVFDCGFKECVGVTCESFFEDAGTPCRAAAGECDRAESCNGHSLACPADAKLSSATECRAAVDACDAAEHCDGSSNDCPADVGVLPTISRVSILDSAVSPGQRRFDFELLGENLCVATVDGVRGFDQPLLVVAPVTPASRLSSFVGYIESLGPMPSGTLAFDVNRGAVAGTLQFVAGAPDGSIAILSPGDGATVGSDPTFSISHTCSNCGVVRVAIFDQFRMELFAETPDSFAPPPLATPTELGLGDLVGEPLPNGLPEGEYVLAADAIDGAIVENQGFAGDTSGVQFAYRFGTSSRHEIHFSVPEAAARESELGAIALLAACAAARGGADRRG